MPDPSRIWGGERLLVADQWGHALEAAFPSSSSTSLALGGSKGQGEEGIIATSHPPRLAVTPPRRNSWLQGWSDVIYRVPTQIRALVLRKDRFILVQKWPPQAALSTRKKYYRQFYCEKEIFLVEKWPRRTTPIP